MSYQEITSIEQALDRAENTKLKTLCSAADRLRREVHGDRFALCSILNARSGKCTEDCIYCAQSAKYTTKITEYELLEATTALGRARENEAYGVTRLSLVTAGHSLSTKQLNRMGEVYSLLKKNSSLHFCASMGFLTAEKASLLHSFGVRRYHCNLESCHEFFPSICTTHTWEEKVATLQIAKNAGLDLCSGGIIGMGESMTQRLQLAFALRDLHVLSIPINILSPIAGTPLENMEPIELDAVLRSVAMFRLINPQAVIRIAGGRGRFGSEQYRLFRAGANGAIVGDYLTTTGAGAAKDLCEFRKLGYELA